MNIHSGELQGKRGFDIRLPAGIEDHRREKKN